MCCAATESQLKEVDSCAWPEPIDRAAFMSIAIRGGEKSI